MSDPIAVYHGSPKELVVIKVTVDGAVVASGYQVCILPPSVRPLAADSHWQTPDVAGSDSGIFVGPATSNVFQAGDIGQPWYYLVDSPEQIIEPASPSVYFT